MAKKGFLKNNDECILPITRGELIFDSSGKQALRSDAFKATTSDHGLMTKEDKQKLDSIAAGAEVNVQSDWNATSGDAYIKNKPTSLPANGGNADTVDGKHASDFASSTHSHTHLIGVGYQNQANLRDLTKFPETNTLYSGGWATYNVDKYGGYNTGYGTTLDISHSTWYQRLAFDTQQTNGKQRIEYFSGINTDTLTKIGDLAYLSDIPTSLKNPNKLSLTVGTNAAVEYDGSAVKAVTITPANIGAATPAYVNNAIANLVDSAPETLNTLNELAAALGEDENFSTTVMTLIGNKVDNTQKGDMTTPIYIDESGETQTCYYDFEDGYLITSYDGSLTYSSAFIGAENNPIYIDDGRIQACNTTYGSATKGIYINQGVFTPMTYDVSANISSGTVNQLAYYSDSRRISAVSSSYGTSIRPIYLNAGVPTPVSITPNTTSTLYLTGVMSANSGFYTGIQGSTGVRILSGNTLYSYGGFYESSDATLKDFQKDVDVNLIALKSIPKKYFTWKDDSSQTLHIGTSAQEIQKLYPELVNEDDNGILHVAYDKLSIVALKAVDKLYEMIQQLHVDNVNLQKKILELEKKL